MNIDVTATLPGYSGTAPNTWSEKFYNVTARSDQGSLVILREASDDRGRAIKQSVAEYAPGTWLSWRQMGD